jgi:hypothetical protein
MTAHQCPRCPLRFSFRTELEFHLREDHDHGQGAEATGDAPEPVVPQPLTDPIRSRPDELVAASVTALMVSPRSGVLPGEMDRSPSSWPQIELTTGTREGKKSVDVHGIDRPLPAVTLMPRWVIMTVIALVVIVLGLGLLFG